MQVANLDPYIYDSDDPRVNEISCRNHEGITFGSQYSMMIQFSMVWHMEPDSGLMSKACGNSCEHLCRAS